MVDKTCVEEKLIDGFNSEEEEALSLCDLPLDIEETESNKNQEEAKKSIHEEDFDFASSFGNSITTEPSEMCAAEDVLFFKGQNLPSRHSVSSETFLNRVDSQGPSRSESMDRSWSAGSTSYSSRSSSYKSHYSSSSTSTNSNKPRIRNNFLTHPSPNPQIRTSSTNRLPRIANPNNHRSSSASVWDFFRLGLVRTPGIELARNSVSRNSSSNSSSSNNKNVAANNVRNSNNEEKKQLIDKQRKPALGMFSGGCKCSVSTIEAIPVNSNTKSSSSSRQAMIEKVEKLEQKDRQLGTEDKKQSLSRIRTFEWIKQLSHASYNDRQMLLSTKN